jgi:hypothetical protein
VFVNRGVQNVIITLGAEVRLQISPMFIHLTHSGRILPNMQPSRSITARESPSSTESRSGRYHSCWRHLCRSIRGLCRSELLQNRNQGCLV